MPSDSDKIRSSTRWRELSKRLRKETVFCERCQVGLKMEVHHINPLSERPELAFKRSNLIVVCDQCHREIEASREPLPLLGPSMDEAERWEQNLQEISE